MPKSPTIQQSPRVLIPRSSASTAVSSPSESNLSSPSSAISPIPNLSHTPVTAFSNKTDSESFQNFIKQTLVGGNEESWRNLLYQAYVTSPSIQFTIVSIGSMHHDAAADRYRCPHNSPITSRCLPASHECFTTSLLLNCFESSYGYRLCAIEAVSDGLHSIGELYSGQHVAELRRILNDQSRKYADDHNAEIRDTYSPRDRKYANEPPQSFSSLEEAKILLVSLIRRSLHALACSLHFANSPSSHRSRPPLNTKLPSAEQQRILQDCMNWDLAFSVSFLALTTLDGEVKRTERLYALTLKLLFLGAYLFVSSNALSLVLGHGYLDSQLKELIEVSSSVKEMRNDSKTKELALETLDILPLTLVSWYLPGNAMELKELALDLLGSIPQKAGMCDGVLVVKIMRFLDSESISVRDSKEVRLSFDANESIAVISYRKPNAAASKEFKEITISS
ncbi:hypothetical protein PVAG01_00403 [Phlyctema vagabunda]|uniref:Uncharacterized protein n=1 Tax=Phlyctema vagabunda TaxID=108571 RepID=A0ABR4PUE8_9HELO